MKHLKSTIKISGEVFVINAILFGLTLIICLGMLLGNAYNASIHQIESYTKSTNEHMTLLFERYINGLSSILTVIYEDERIIYEDIHDPQVYNQILDTFRRYELTNEDIRFIYAGYEDGTLLINNWEPTSDYSCLDRPWYRAARNAMPEMSVAKPYLDIRGDIWYISMSQALLDDDGNLIGVVAIDSVIDKVFEVIDHGKLYETQESYIVSEDGVIYIHPDTRMIGDYIPQISKELTSDEGPISYALPGQERIGYYRQIEETGWYIVTVIDRDEVTTPLKNHMIKIAIVGSGYIGILAFSFVMIFNMRFVKPLRALAARIHLITSGKSMDDALYMNANQEFHEIARKIESLAENSLARKRQELVTIIEATKEGIIATSLDGDILYVKSAFYDLFNMSPNDASYDSLEKIKAYIMELNDDCHLARLLHRRSTMLQLKGDRILEQRFEYLKDEDDATGYLWNFRDVSETQRHIKVLSNLALKDELTALPNRRSFVDSAEKLIQEEVTHAYFLLMDIDLFKSVNDRFGHLTGDRVLERFSMILKTVFAHANVIGRLGGEEFAVILAEVSHEVAEEMAENMRAEIEGAIFYCGDKAFGVTVSIGIAQYNKGMNLLEVADYADKAMYEAKRTGRNRVINAKM